MIARLAHIFALRYLRLPARLSNDSIWPTLADTGSARLTRI